MTRILFITVFFILHSSFFILHSHAIPAKKIPFTVKLSNGDSITVVLTGDENFHYIVTLADGIPVVENEAGEYELRPDLKNEYIERWSAKARKRNNTRIHKAAESKARNGAQKSSAYIGEKRGLVILVNFPDLEMSFTSTIDVFNDMFNLKGYNKNNSTGSIHDYFYDQSYGKFDIEFDIVGPVTTSKGYTYYGENDSEGYDKHVAELTSEVCQLADPYIDFSQYDWDGDGEVEMVYIIYAGYGENSNAGKSTIWPHEWTLSEGAESVPKDGDGAVWLDGVKIDTYAMSCELRGRTGSTLDGIGIACHEFSHCLGLPDFYDTSSSGDGEGMGFLDVLDSGSYNGPAAWGGDAPAGYTAYERNFCGWLDFTVLDETCSVTNMPELQDEAIAYVIYNDAHPDEYFILENRQSNRWFRYVYNNTSTHGLLIYHVDYDEYAWQENLVNAESNHQRMSYIPAGNFYPSYSYRPVLFPGSYSVSELTDTSHENCGGKLFNANTDGSYYMHKEITDIEENDGLISFNFTNYQQKEPDGLENISGDDFKTEPLAQRSQYYTLDGIKISEPTAPGIYIVKKGDIIRKKLITR